MKMSLSYNREYKETTKNLYTNTNLSFQLARNRKLMVNKIIPRGRCYTLCLLKCYDYRHDKYHKFHAYIKNANTLPNNNPPLSY